MDFSERLSRHILKTKSIVCAGFDPNLEQLPGFILESSAKQSQSSEDQIEWALTAFGQILVESLSTQIACFKPNIAFFEQYGIAGLKAYRSFIKAARNAEVPVIGDIKRGDIASTAEAYARAHITGGTWKHQVVKDFLVDAVTINPFLGFDTLETISKACDVAGAGMFVLVRTSNPGSKDLQDRVLNGVTASSAIAQWLATKAAKESSSYSRYGAVVGATHPEEAAQLRTLMPKSWFLVPGYGAQGASALEATSGRGQIAPWGIVVNISRALSVSGLATIKNEEELRGELLKRAASFSAELNNSLPTNSSNSLSR